MLKGLLKSVFAALVLTGVIILVAPNHAKAVGSWIDGVSNTIATSWCQEEGGACLESQRRRLSSSKESLVALEDKLTGQRATVATVLSDNQRLLASNQHWLGEGRNQWNAWADGTVTVTFGGVVLSKTQLRDQLASLYAESKVLQQVIADSTDVLAKLDRERDALLAQRVRVEATLRMLPAKAVLLSATTTQADIDSAVKTIDEVLDGAKNRQVAAAASVIRSTEELSKLTASARALPSAEFEAWLNQH